MVVLLKVCWLKKIIVIIIVKHLCFAENYAKTECFFQMKNIAINSKMFYIIRLLFSVCSLVLVVPDEVIFKIIEFSMK